MNRIYCSVRRAPVAEDIPDDPVVALLREEGDGRLPFMRPARATLKFYRSLLPRRPGANASQCAAIYDDVSQARGSCRLGSNQWCDFERNRKCVDRSACVWCYDRLGAHPGGVKLVNLTSSHLARKMARRDKRHRRSGRPVVQHDIQKTRFVKNMQRRRPACEATAEGCTPEEMERWAGIS